MLFSVDQEGFFSLQLAWEYGRVLGRSRRKRLLGKLLFFPGAYLIFVGGAAALGAVFVIWHPESPEEREGIEIALVIGLLFLLWGMSWCGFNRLPTALVRLARLRRVETTTYFYLGYVEDNQNLICVNYPYEAVQAVYEGKRAFYLQTEPKQFLILQKSGFTTGDPDAFRRFMDERGGQPVIMI